MSLRGLAVVLAVVAVALSGCLADDAEPGPAEPAGADAADAPTPAGCDRDRRTIAHGPGGEPTGTEAQAWTACSTHTGYIAIEPTLGVTANGTVLFAPAQTDAWSSLDPDAIAVSRDGGATWERRVPTLAGQPTHPLSLDPFLHHDRSTGRTFVDDLAPLNCKSLSITDEAGTSWNHTLAGCTQTDHQSVFTGPPTTSTTTGYPNVVYRCAANLVGFGPEFGHATTCQRSLDGGLTWLPSGEPAFVSDPRHEGQGQLPAHCGPLPGHGTTGPDGTVYLPKGWCGQPWLAISDDEGITWDRVQVAGNGMAAWGDIYDHEAMVATDEAGNVYYLWTARDRHPYLAASTDGGETWTDPMAVGHPNLTQATRPAIAAGSPGHVAIGYVGSTDAPTVERDVPDCVSDPTPCRNGDDTHPRYDDATWHAYLSVSTDALADEPTLQTARVNEANQSIATGYCHPADCSGEARIGHFIDVEIGPESRPWAAFVDGGERNGTAGQGLLASLDPSQSQAPIVSGS